MNVVCPHCMTTNRVADSRLGEKPLCGQCRKRLLPGEPISLTDERFAQYVNRNDLPVVVDFWAGWCAPCKMMAPVFAGAAAEWSTRCLFAKVDTEVAPRVAQEFAIRSIPTLVLLQHGKERKRVSGALNAAQLRGWLAELA